MNMILWAAIFFFFYAPFKWFTSSLVPPDSFVLMMARDFVWLGLVLAGYKATSPKKASQNEKEPPPPGE